MKVMKKFAGMVLAVCLMVPVLATAVSAAEGVLMFSDPSTKVGETVDIDLVVQSDSGETIGDVNVVMKYDSSALEFVGGDGFTAGENGTLTYTGTGSSSEVRATMEFRALKTGSATVSVESSSASVATGDTLNLEQGSSSVTIAAADDGTTSIEPSESSDTATAGDVTGIVVDVNGTEYNFSEAFTSADIPEGFSETTMTFSGEERKFVSNAAGVCLGYLVDSSGKGSFFRYNEENASFTPFVELSISDSTSIIPLDDSDAVNLPDNYQQVELTVQEQQFPAWSDPEQDRYYIIYALNMRTGENSLYQYDKEDGTYQYFLVSESDSSAEQSSLSGIGALVAEKFMLVAAAVAAVFLILLIILIILGIKLIHRNQELDDLYDEYDIQYDDEEETAGKKSKKNTSVPNDDEYEYEDEYDDEYEDEYDDAYEDEYDDEDYEDEYDDEYEDDSEEDLPDTRVVKKEKKKNRKADSDYNINFVDL